MLECSLALEPLDEIDEQRTFLSILYHDIRGGNAIRILFGTDHKVKKIYADNDYQNIEYRSVDYNAYTSINTFKSYKRKAEDVYNFSGIYIDCDGHGFKQQRKWTMLSRKQNQD